MIIGVDADITFFKSGEAWRRWLSEVTGRPSKDIQELEKGFDTLPYDLSSLYDITLQEAMGFWQDKDLYANMPVVEGATEVINNLIEQGHEVGFVTYCKSGHFSSKCDRLKEIFPDLAFINVTKEKKYSRVDVMIDDRVEYLEGFGDGVEKLLIKSPYRQNKPIPDDIIVFNNWKEIGEYLWV